MLVPVKPPGELVAVYCEMGEPPIVEGAVKATDALKMPAVADTPVGAPGTVDGVTELDGVDGDPVPTPLVAVTVNV